ncbi:hepatitis A virus cellular receptor 1 isoform X2 [Xiphias gladius]|uniref:hepatitis A virus cellular receptor 1 isoform X2 n=1 Tax=Xiphias gladius TaxID=8245 RepID=UPI001A993806|nr:hepatitis A virus cellular receptor 1 isoform X2 [Xiphias gladius]
MKIVLLLALLTVGDGDSSRLVGRPGENVTLQCRYDITKHGSLSFCWNRGAIPNTGCNSPIIATNTGTRDSSRYQLQGQLDEGDVSLTILNVTETDAGRYGCRVEIPGWFNDDKHHFDLTIEDAPQTTTSAPADGTNRDTSTQQTADGQAAGQMTATGSVLTSSPIVSVKAEKRSSGTVALVCVLFGLAALVAAGGVVIIAVRKWRRLNKIPRQQRVHSSVQFSSTLSTLQLQSRGSAVENIYQIDGGADGDEYESCP